MQNENEKKNIITKNGECTNRYIGFFSTTSVEINIPRWSFWDVELNEFHANQFFWFSKETTTHQFGHLNNPYFVWYHLIARWGTEQKKERTTKRGCGCDDFSWRLFKLALKTFAMKRHCEMTIVTDMALGICKFCLKCISRNDLGRRPMKKEWDRKQCPNWICFNHR